MNNKLVPYLYISLLNFTRQSFSYISYIIVFLMEDKSENV